MKISWALIKVGGNKQLDYKSMFNILWTSGNNKINSVYYLPIVLFLKSRKTGHTPDNTITVK